MDQKIQWAVNHMPKTDDKNLPIMGLEEIGKARTFHESFPQYSKTPLTKLDHMAEYLGVKEIYLKDESYRFGLNAFKVLGGSFAMARYIASETGKDVSELPYSVLTSDQLRKEFGQATFFTATDGNHGRGVAWAANRLGQKAVVHMPKGSTQTRLQNIAKEGAQVDIQEMNYDDCVRLAAKEADETERGVIVQDTAWDGYEEIPAWIMQGYGTMAMEAGEQLKEYGCERPTHIFVQAGVGSLAGAVVGYYSNLYADNPPTFVVVEAEAAACLYKGAAAGDGDIRIVDGDMETIMAGLACGMRMLGAPIKGDAPVTSGESGAAPFGALAAVMTMDEYKDLRNDIGLDASSKVLLFSTEGDTDPDRYKNIVWKGLDK